MAHRLLDFHVCHNLSSKVDHEVVVAVLLQYVRHALTQVSVQLFAPFVISAAVTIRGAAKQNFCPQRADSASLVVDVVAKEPSEVLRGHESSNRDRIKLLFRATYRTLRKLNCINV